MLDFYESSTAPFNLFYRDLVKVIYQESMTASQREADDDVDKIVDAYATPAQRIIKLLVKLKHNLHKLNP